MFHWKIYVFLRFTLTIQDVQSCRCLIITKMIQKILRRQFLTNLDLLMPTIWTTSVSAPSEWNTVGILKATKTVANSTCLCFVNGTKSNVNWNWVHVSNMFMGIKGNSQKAVKFFLAEDSFSCKMLPWTLLFVGIHWQFQICSWRVWICRAWPILGVLLCLGLLLEDFQVLYYFG